MNQQEAADALGCSVSTVSRLCSGDRLPSVQLMREIRRVLSWSVEAQVSAQESGVFHHHFTQKMDRRRVRTRMRRPRSEVRD